MTAGLIGFALMLILLLAGLPIAFAMMSVGFVGYGLISSFKAALGTLSLQPFSTAMNYNLCVVPLFTLMGEFAYQSGIIADLYDAIYKWIGHRKGGLCQATIVACAGFAATTGSSLAGSTLLTQVAWPEMKSRRYKASLALGCIAAGGTIGILIPPSTPMIVYGSITGVSVGKLFIAGLVPGLLMTTLFILTITIVSAIQPDLAPGGKKFSWKERFESLKGVWMMLLLIIVVLGGLWGGFFTPVEAAAIGSAGALLITLLRKRLSWKGFMDSLLHTTKITGMVFTLMIGCSVFTTFIGATHLPTEVATWVGSLAVPNLVIILCMLSVYIILGCLMDTLSMTLLTVPIFYPIVTALGYNLIWFGIMVVIMTQLGSITPPVGINVFAVSGMVKDVPMYTIFKGVVPFAIAIIAIVALLIAFPTLVTFLIA